MGTEVSNQVSEDSVISKFEDLNISLEKLRWFVEILQHLKDGGVVE